MKDLFHVRVLALAAALPMLATAAPAQGAKTTFPYPLTVCPVSGEKLGSMGDPVSATFEGREVQFCCDRCPRRFEKDVDAGLAKLDEAIVADQKPLYPLETSVVSGKALGAKPIDLVHGDRLVRLADESEKATFLADPAKYRKPLDEAVVAKQAKAYSLTTCPLEGAKLGDGAVDVVVAGRLVRACCASCAKKVTGSPLAALLAIDAAGKGGAAGAKDPKKKGGSGGE